MKHTPEPCVNACAQISTERLEANCIAMLAIERMEIRQQRDELLSIWQPIAEALSKRPDTVAGESAPEKVLELIAHRDELLAALKYHQEQTRPIQQTVDLITRLEAQS